MKKGLTKKQRLETLKKALQALGLKYKKKKYSWNNLRRHAKKKQKVLKFVSVEY